MRVTPITDYTMPQMTGDALTRALRRLRPDIPIILETASVTPLMPSKPPR